MPGLRDQLQAVKNRLEGAGRFLLPKQFGGMTNAEAGQSLLQGVLSPGSTPPPRTAADYLEAYSRLPWLRAIVGKISFSIASVEWTLSAQTRGGRAIRSNLARSCALESRQAGMARLRKQGELTEIVDHPALDLLNNPNPFLTSLGTRKVMQAHLDLVGEHFWLLEKNVLGVPFRVWPVPPNWVLATPTPSSPFFHLRFNTFDAKVPAEDVIAFYDDDPKNPYGRGTGVSMALGDDLEADEYAAKHIKQRFFNRTIPELLITVEDTSAVELKREETRFRQTLQGVFKQLVPYFMNRKVDVKTLGDSFKSLQITQLRTFERDMCINVFGVPPEILGIIANSNRATITAADFLYSRWVLVPRLELIRATLQEKLLPLFDDRLILDYVSPVKEDFKEQLEAMKAATWAWSVDEWRAIGGGEALPEDAGLVHPITGGVSFREPDELVQSAPNMTPNTPPEGGDDAQDGDEKGTRNRARELAAVKRLLGIAA